MTTVDSREAMTTLPALLNRVARGESITILDAGRPVARLVPAAPSGPMSDVRAAIEEMRRFQRERGPVLGDDLTIRDLIEEGRRF